MINLKIQKIYKIYIYIYILYDEDNKNNDSP